jgi:branched-chain amino acid transport system substrate-binding protein
MIDVQSSAKFALIPLRDLLPLRGTGEGFSVLSAFSRLLRWEKVPKGDEGKRRSWRMAACIFLLLATPAQAEILVGLAGPMGGTNAVFGQQMKAGADAAVTAVNASGGINGEPLKLIVADDGCDTRRAFDVAQDLARQDVRVVIGHFCSGAMIAAGKTYLDAGILAITPAATLPAVTEQNAWNIIRLAPRDDAQGELAAKRIAQDVALAKLAIIGDGQAVLRGLAQRVKLQSPSASEHTISSGKTDHSAAIAEIKAAGANVIYLALTASDAGTVAKSLRAAGIDAPIYGPDLLLNEVYWERAGDAGENTRVSFATDPASRANPFKAEAAIPDATNREGAALPSYAAVEAFVSAAKATDVNNGRAMADWLKGGNAIETVLGTLRFDAKGDLANPPFTWYRWNNGQFAQDKP